MIEILQEQVRPLADLGIWLNYLALYGGSLLAELLIDNNVEIIITSDGSYTLRVTEIDEHYHSIHGAVQESMTVFIQNGYDFCKKDEISVLEIGFGTGLNTLLTLARSSGGKKKIIYTTIEKYPLEKVITDKLNYENFVGKNLKGMLGIIHSAPWERSVTIAENFVLKKLRSDFTSDRIEGNYDLIYFDAFAPDKQPEMWTEPIFIKLASVTRPGGIFVTYSAKGAIKRLLRSSGFEVKLLPGPPGKREMIRAVKI